MATTFSIDYGDLSDKSLARVLAINELYLDAAEVLGMSNVEFRAAVADLNQFVLEETGMFAITGTLSSELKKAGILNG